jgi:hypothetical protein
VGYKRAQQVGIAFILVRPCEACLESKFHAPLDEPGRSSSPNNCIGAADCQQLTNGGESEDEISQDLSHVRALSIFKTEANHREVLSLCTLGRRLVASIQHHANAGPSGDPPTSEARMFDNFR